jgi:small subunit ribosomal protein S15
MYLTTEVKKNILSKHGQSTKDTGSSEGQIALFTHRIQHLSEHVKINKKDMVTRRSLVGLVGQRRKLLDYLKERDIVRYRAILKELNLRK